MNIIDVTHNKKVSISNQKMITKNAILEYYLTRPIIASRSKDTIKTGAFTIPSIKEFNNLYTINYKVNELKIIQKHYNIKCSGNKEHLKQYLYNYLFYSYKISIIQKNARLLLN